MSYCSKCGAYIPEGEQSCLACGYRDSSAMGNFSAENNKKRMSIGSGTNSGSPGKKLVIRYSSKRRSGGDGAARHLSSKRQAPQTGAAESEEVTICNGCIQKKAPQTGAAESEENGA